MPNLSLYEIERALQDLLEMREQASSEQELAVVDQAISEYVAREVRKVDGIAEAHAAFVAAAMNARSEAQRLLSRADQFLKTADRIKDAALFAMRAQQITKLTTAAHELRVQPNGGQVPLDVNESLVPDQYKRAVMEMSLLDAQRVLRLGVNANLTLISADKKQIREALEAGGTIPGATLGERGVHLRVK